MEDGEPDPEALRALREHQAQEGMSDALFREAVRLLPRAGGGGGGAAEPSLEALMEDADPEQLKYLLLARDQQGMSDLIFRQALQLLPTKSGGGVAAAPAPAGRAADGLGLGLDVEGTPQDSAPPGLTPEERVAWDRDGFFWRRGCFTAAEIRAAKREVQPACEPDVAPLGMVTGPGARVFFADDPTAPDSVHALAADRNGVVGALGEIVGPDVDYLYTKAVWKDATVQTGFGWHWDHTYWGGAPKFSTWLGAKQNGAVDRTRCCVSVPSLSWQIVVYRREIESPRLSAALDDTDEANGCLKLVAGSHRCAISTNRARVISFESAGHRLILPRQA
jgi:hypothetical protein